MVRRYLGFTINEWENLPWWQRDAYWEELEYDAPWQRELCGMAQLPEKPPREVDVDQMDDITTLGIKTKKATFASE